MLSRGDGWLPLPLYPIDVLRTRITELWERAGRQVPVTLYGADPEKLAEYAEAGVDRVLFELEDHEEADDVVRQLDRLAS
ncbi:hypothetical protein [Amycolatopsis circi]|uniref:hypothetical protein n=1 Tax=Amycolatopsis circi TaxID=871959 RepID=UPI000E22F6DC|nr:hypothetical protein [Amycolatopsis circi]